MPTYYQVFGNYPTAKKLVQKKWGHEKTEAIFFSNIDSAYSFAKEICQEQARTTSSPHHKDFKSRSFDKEIYDIRLAYPPEVEVNPKDKEYRFIEAREKIHVDKEYGNVRLIRRAEARVPFQIKERKTAEIDGELFFREIISIVYSPWYEILPTEFEAAVFEKEINIVE